MNFLVSIVLLALLHHLVAGLVHRLSKSAIKKGRDSAKRTWILCSLTLTPVLFFPPAYFILKFALPNAYDWAIAAGSLLPFSILVSYTYVDLTQYSFDNERVKKTMKKYSSIAEKIKY